MRRKTKLVAIPEFDCPLQKMPPPDKQPYTPDMFTCEPGPLPSFPPPRRMSREEKRIHKELKRLHFRTASYPASEKSSSMAVAIPWEFFKIIFAGVFVFFKYAFIAVAVIITVGCMICAGRQTTGLR